MPWWRFASYHVERGLQAESLLASMVWALHFAGVPAGWELVWRTNEVTGPLASSGRARTADLDPGDARSRRRGDDDRVAAGSRTSRRVPVADIASVLLLPLAAFVATNNVLSPQFHLWLLPLAALVLFAWPTP